MLHAISSASIDKSPMRRLLQTGIAPLLAVSTGAVTLILTLLLVQGIERTASTQVESDIGQGLAELAFQTTDKLDRGMYERYREVQLMAERYEITEKGVPTSAKRAVLESMQETYPYYAWIGMTDTSGKVLVGTKGMLEGADVSKRPWYVSAYRDEHLTDMHEALMLAKLLPNPSTEPERFFDVAFPYRRADGEILGILGTHLSWQWAQDIEDSVLRPLAKRKSVETMIVSRKGRVLLGPPRYRDAELHLTSFAASQNKRNGFVTETWPDGKRYLVGFSQSQGFRSYPGLGWTVLVRQDLEEAYRPVYELKRKVFLVGLIAAALISTLLWAIARRVTGPLRTIARHADALRLGMNTHIPPVKSQLTEVRVLERALNALLGNLREKEEGLRELNANLESRVRARTGDLHKAAQQLEASERLLRTVADNMPVLIAYIDRDERYQFANATYEAWFGIGAADVVGKSVRELLGDAQYEREQDALRRNLSGERVRFETQVPGPEGARYVEVVGIPDIKDGVTHGVYVLTSDITAAKRHQEELHQLARVDALTGLPNRRSYEERLNEALQRANRTGRGIALMFLDVDHFKQINDAFGHAGGDAVLKEFGSRLKASVRSTDIVSRLAGDEFTIVLEGLNDVNEAALVAGKIVDAFKIPVQVDQTALRVSTSIGIAFVTSQGIDAQTLCHQADIALYRAKANGRGQYTVF
jgi:diguanylate cyclase (GGDEF)-like protein/PAS domain S-box-containing protein